MKIFWSLLFCFFIMTWNINAQQPDLVFKRLGVVDGLSQSWVKSICQDKQGFMWFGTSDGLNRFDGYTFHLYKNRQGDPSGLPGNYILSLTVDNEGTFWVGGLEYLARYDPEKDAFEALPALKGVSVYTLIHDQGFLYIGCQWGIAIYDLKQQKLLSDKADVLNRIIAYQKVNCLTRLPNGQIAVGTERGLWKLNIQSRTIEEFVKPHLPFGELAQRCIKVLKVAKSGNIWIGTLNNGVYRLKSQSSPLPSVHFSGDMNSPDSLAKGAVFSMLERTNGEIWIGLENGGLSVWKGNDQCFTNCRTIPGDNKSLSSNSIHAIYEDVRHDIWLGTYGGGINLFNGNGVNFYHIKQIPNKENSLVNNNVNVIYKDSNYLWIGTEDGLSRMNLQTRDFKHFRHQENNPNSIAANAISSINIDSRGDLWIASWEGGVSRYNSALNQFTTFSKTSLYPMRLTDNKVFSTFVDKNEDLWVATMGGGLNRLNLISREAQDYRAYLEGVNCISSDWLQQVYKNKRGELWIATTSGVCLFDQSKNTFFNFDLNGNMKHIPAGNGIETIFEDSKGTMWFGSNAGLSYFQRSDSSFVVYQEQDGLPNNSVNSILEDKHGNLWLGTNLGLSEFIEGISLPKKPLFKNYDVSDGLQGNEFNRRAAYKDSRGYMYFGGVNGLSYFHPDSLKQNTVAPQVVITDFQIFNKSVKRGEANSPLQKHISFTRELVLPWESTVFSFEFAALSYLAPDRNVYKYQLQGFDKTWSEPSTKRSATYTNLKEGNYIFKVLGANNDGIWSEKPVQIHVTVLPPWWRTWWAYSFYVLLFSMGLLALLYLNQKRIHARQEIHIARLQREQEEQMSAQKLQFFTNISHEFRTPLTLISSPLNDILSQKNNFSPELTDKLRTIHRNANRLNRLIDELMDFRKLEYNKLRIRPAKIELNQFLEHILAYFAEEARSNHVLLSLQRTSKPLFAFIDRSFIEKVIYNLLANAFKVMGDEGAITVSLLAESKTGLPETIPNETPVTAQAQEWVVIRVQDTGPGLAPDQLERIFDRFYQIDTVNKSYYSSTGIGLSLAKSLTEMHGGYITVASELGFGATFSIWLPREQQVEQGQADDLLEQSYPTTQVNEPQAAFESSEPLNQPLNEPTLTHTFKTVLLVEDNADLRKYLRTELKKYYQIKVAKDGLQGLALAQDLIPDLIISDVMMPGMDGYQLCRTLKEQEQTAHIPILLLTAKAAIEDQISGADQGADAYITKPFNIQLLQATVGQLIRNREQVAQRFKAQWPTLADSQIPIRNTDEALLHTLTQYVLAHLSADEISPEVLAQEFSLSRSQLYRKIKQLSGHSLGEFVRIIRLQQARTLLQKGQQTISEVGYEVGFSTPSYFSKCYKEYFGKLPSEESLT